MRKLRICHIFTAVTKHLIKPFFVILLHVVLGVGMLILSEALDWPAEGRGGLFFAGAMLTLVYFYYKNIWLPIGLHFGNNYLGSFLKDYEHDNLLFGQEGYISTAVLAVIFVVYAWRAGGHR